MGDTIWSHLGNIYLNSRPDPVVRRLYAVYGSYDAVYAALPDMISTSDLSFLEHMEITDTWKVRDQSAPPLVREASAQRLINNCRLNNEPSDPGAGLMGPSGAIWDHMGPNG